MKNFLKISLFSISSLLITTIIVFVILAIVANYKFIGLEKATFGIKFKNPKIIYQYDTERDFHGDGITLEVIKVSKIDIDKFIKIMQTDKNRYPKRHYHYGDYEIRPWKKAPKDNNDALQINFGCEIPKNRIHEEVDSVFKYLSLAKKYLDMDDTYYAMFFKDHPYEMYGIDLFIVNTNENVIIIINRQ